MKACVSTTSAWALVFLVALSPHAARSCVVFQFIRSGFTANVNNLLACISLYGDGSNGTLFLDGTNFRYSCSDPELGAWQDFFEVDFGDVKALSKETLGGALKDCSQLGVDDMNPLLGKINLPVPVALEMGARMAWKPDAIIRKRVQDHMDALAGFPGPTVAFHVRGGDKTMEDDVLRRRTTRPLDLVNTALQAWPEIMAQSGTCILVGDDRRRMAEVERLLRESARCTIYYSNVHAYEKGHDQQQFNYNDLASRCEQSRQVVADLELLARADYAVASYTSGFAALVEALRVAVYNKTRKTFVDASQHHRDAWGAVRRFFADPV